MNTPPTLRNVFTDLYTDYDMADQYEDALRYEEHYVRDVVFYLADDGTQPEQQEPVKDDISCGRRKGDDKDAETNVQTEKQTATASEIAKTDDGSKLVPTNVIGPNATDAKEEKGENQEDELSESKTIDERTKEINKENEGNCPVEYVPTEKDVMEIYEEHERRFTEDILSPRCLSPEICTERPRLTGSRRSRSRSPCSPIAGAGLEHLDNLVKLLEQLTKLKEQNRCLRKKCQYLENTKSLLYVHNVMLKSQMSKSSSPKIKGRSKSAKIPSRSKVLQHQHVSDGEVLGHHYASDSSDDGGLREQTAAWTKPNKLTQRSQSVGSINVDLVDIDLTLGPCHSGQHRLSKRQDKIAKEFNRFEAMFSKSKISSKWERVKKVFSGKPETSTKSEHATITAEQLVRANSKYTTKPPSSLPQMIPGASSSTQDSSEKQSRTSTSPSSPTTGPAEPSSPVSLENEPMIPCVIADDQDAYDEILVMGGMDSFIDTESNHSAHTPSPHSDEGQTEPRTPTPKSGSMSASADAEKSKSNFLTVQETSLKRRQSSPTLCMSDDSDAQSTEARGDSFLELPRTPTIQRSSSFKVTKSTDSFADVSDDSSTRTTTPKGTEGRKYHSHRSAWGRVKDIIHTRKDSLKRKNKRSNSAGDMLPDASTVDGLYDYGSKSDVEDVTYDRDNSDDVSPRSSSPKLVRKGSGYRGHPPPTSSPKASPPRTRKLERPETPPAPTRSKGPDIMKSPSVSPPPQATACKEVVPFVPRGSTSPATGPLDVSALMGGMSEEFNRKMQEWEEKKLNRRSLFKDNSISLEDDGRDSSDAARFTEEFIRKMEEWERMKGLGSPPKSRPGASQTQSPDVCTPPDHSGAPPSMEELQKHLSESFSKTVQEWERIKTQRIKETGSPIQDTSSTSKCMDKRSRKQERSKSRERDRSRSKYDKQRERELQKIEKKELKIEKERQKLEKMKMKLEGIETRSDMFAEGVSQEFARKLHEWEVMKGLRQDHTSTTGGDDSIMTVSTDASRLNSTVTQITHTRSHSAKAYKEYFSEKRERTQSESQVDDLQLGAAGTSISTERRKSEAGRSSSVPSIRSGSRQLVDDSTSIDLNLTNQDAQSADEWKRSLLTDIAARDEELSAMHYEVQQLTERISCMDIDHNKQIENFKRELWASSQVGRFTIETDLVQASVNELRLKVDHLTGYQGKLVNERNHLQLQMEAELRARKELEAKLINQVRQLPVKASHHQQAVESVQDFDKLCEFFLKLWSQLNELRLGILERNKLLADMQQHVLQQEVGNRLLAAEMASRDLQLAYLQEARKRRVLRRSHTFAGRDHMTRGTGDTKIWTKQHQAPNYHAFFSEAISDLRHGDIEAAPVDWEWLERLRAQRASAIGRIQSVAAMASHESQTEVTPVSSTDLTDNSAQTVMTLCNIPYSPTYPAQRNISPIVLENKGVQANSMTDPEFVPIPQSPIKINPTATSTPIKATSSDPQSPSSNDTNERPQLVRQRRTESPLSPAPSPGKKTNSGEAAFTFNVSSTESAGLVDVVSRFKEDRNSTVPRSPDLNSQDSSDGDSKMTEVGGPWIRRYGTANDDNGETMVPSLYPPPSPIIRSRNTRKLKTEFRVPQLYTDARTWKATPPKRVRHRRTSTEKRPEISNNGERCDENTEHPPKTATLPPRGRARAERFSVPQPRSLSVPPRDSVMYDLCFRDRRDVSGDPGPALVTDMINRFESEGSPPQINCCRGNRSPSPAIRKPMMSPVHKLKSAAELMKDSSGPRRGWHSAGHTRATSLSPVPHGSSDKENEKSDSMVQYIVHRLSRENTPERVVSGAVGGRPMSPTGELIRQTVRRLSESSCDVKPALIDLTNGGHIAKKSDSFTERRFSPERPKFSDRSSPSRTLSAIKKHYELPRKGQVSKYTKVYETKVETKEVIVEPISKRASMPSPPLEPMSKSPICDSIKSIPGALKTEDENIEPQLEIPPVRSQTLDRPKKSASSSSSPTSTLSGSARDLKMKLFGKREKKGGALAALCKQTLSVDVKSRENVHVPDEAMSSGSDSLKRSDNPHEKSSKTRRFLDTNWLQRPKRFFKVSK